MHRVLGIEPWDSRIVVLVYFLGTFLSTVLGLGLEGFVASMVVPPLLLYHGDLRRYVAALAPFPIIAMLNFAALIIIYGFTRLWAIYPA